MIKRIVKLEIQPDKAADFQKIFEESKMKILAREGCFHVELLRTMSPDNIFCGSLKMRSMHIGILICSRAYGQRPRPYFLARRKHGVLSWMMLLGNKQRSIVSVYLVTNGSEIKR